MSCVRRHVAERQTWGSMSRSFTRVRGPWLVADVTSVFLIDTHLKYVLFFSLCQILTVFSSKQQLHQKSHEGEKCFKCDLCNYSSVSQRHLESHMLIHTDQKPFNCDECDQSFRQKQLLKRHKNLYHNPNYVAPAPKEKTHECPHCNKSFRHKGNLMRHLVIHDPDSYKDSNSEYSITWMPWFTNW